MSDIDKDKFMQEFNTLYETAKTPAFRKSWAQAELAQSKQSRPLLRPVLAGTLSLFFIITITTLINQEPILTRPTAPTIVEEAVYADWDFSTDFLLSQNNNEPFYYTDFLLEISDDSTLTSIPALESSLFNDSEDI